MVHRFLPLGLLLFVGCGPTTHQCARDGQVITDLNTAVVVAIDRRPGKASLSELVHLDEQHYQALPLTSMAARERVPMEDMAEAEQDRLFCSAACAAAMLARKNHAVDSVRALRAAEHVADSLVQDSIRRGLL